MRPSALHIALVESHVPSITVKCLRAHYPDSMLMGSDITAMRIHILYIVYCMTDRRLTFLSTGSRKRFP